MQMGKKRRRSDWLRSYGGRKKKKRPTHPSFPAPFTPPEKRKKKNLNFFSKKGNNAASDPPPRNGKQRRRQHFSSFFVFLKSRSPFSTRAAGRFGEMEVRVRCLRNPSVCGAAYGACAHAEMRFLEADNFPSSHVVHTLAHVRTLWSPIFWGA